MIGLKIDKSMFFDTAKVRRAVSDGTRKVLSKFGAFVMTAARHSIRKRKAVSQPGRPPSSHVGTLKRLIFFGYEPGKKSVVIGPTPFAAKGGTAVVPELLEQDHAAGTTRRIRGTRRGKVVVMTYRARPYMGPAFESEKPKLPALWAGSVK